MLALIKNEYIKVTRKIKNWAVFLLFIVFLGIMVFGQYMSDKNMKHWNSLEVEKTNIEENIGYYKRDIEDNKKLLEDGKGDSYTGDNIKRSEEELKRAEERKLDVEKLISEGKTERDWKDQLIDEKKSIESVLKDIEDGINVYGNNGEQQVARDQERLEQINYYLDNDIKPVNIWEFNPHNIILQLFSGLGAILLILIIAVFVGDSVSGEYTPATLKFLAIQPISRGKILFAKFFTSVTSLIIAILSCQLVTFIVVGAIKGFEAGKSIIEYGVRYEVNTNKIVDGRPIIEKIAGSGEMITLNEFVVRAILMEILFIIAVSAVIFLISTVIKNNLVSMALSVILLIIMNVVAEFGAIGEKVGHLLFTNYGNVTNILTGEIVQYQNNPSVTIQNGIIVMTVTIVISYLLAHIVFNKKDILI